MDDKVSRSVLEASQQLLGFSAFPSSLSQTDMPAVTYTHENVNNHLNLASPYRITDKTQDCIHKHTTISRTVERVPKEFLLNCDIYVLIKVSIHLFVR